LFQAEDYAALRRWMKRAEALWTELHTSGLNKTLAPLNDISFATWLEQEKLPAPVISFIRLTLECELGTDAENFSAVSGLAELRVYLFGEESALHVRGGNSRLIQALSARIKGPVSLGSKVTRIARARMPNGKISATVSYLKDNALHHLSAERVVLATSWMTLHLIQMDPPLPPEAWDALMTLGRGQYTVVHFVVDKKIHALWGGAENAPFPVLTPGPLGVIYGVAEQSPASQSLEVFSLLLHGEPAKEFHMAPHEGKREELLLALEGLWPGFSGFVRDTAIYPYHPAAIPFWPAGRSPFDERAALLFKQFEGIHLAGDYLVSSHSEGAVIAAQRQAEAIARELNP
jgi:monoamine oxidase